MRTRHTTSTIKAKIEELVQRVDSEKSICPSEVARALSTTDWRDLMPLVRRCADELVSNGSIEVTQKGTIIPSAEKAKGPIRLKKKAN